MHEIGSHIVQDPLVVGDDQDAEAVFVVQPLHALRHRAQRVDIKAGVRLVEDGDVGLQHRELQDLRALLLTAGEAVVEMA